MIRGATFTCGGVQKVSSFVGAAASGRLGGLTPAVRVQQIAAFDDCWRLNAAT
jgi:hypothetical protein